MEKAERERLKYRNQYLLSPEQVECPFQHKVHQLGNGYHLYAHRDLPQTLVRDGDVQLILLGDMFDYRNPGHGNEEILKDLTGLDFTEVIRRTNLFSGRYVLIWEREGAMYLLHDATATRKVYYCVREEGAWFSSQPYLLAGMLGLEETRNPDKHDFYSSEIFVRLQNSSIGNLTPFDEILQLLPNHYYRADTRSVVRHWPLEKTDTRSFEDTARECAGMIRGIMEGICNRYEVMLPLTAGKDSRTLLAATRGYSEKVYFYINKEHRLSEDDPDIAVPRKLMRKLGLDYHILDPYVDVEEGFREVYFENNPRASESFLPLIANYHLNFRNRVNLPGNIASAGYELYKGRKVRITAESLARLNKVDKWPFARDYYESWLEGVREPSRRSGVSLLNLFYWEERLANWGSQITLEKDIAQEDFNPFNSRELARLYLSMPAKYIETPFYRFHHRVIRLLWPEVLLIPINHSRRTTILKLTKSVGLLDLYFRYKYSRLKGF
jgi:hypothetical protein